MLVEDQVHGVDVEGLGEPVVETLGEVPDQPREPPEVLDLGDEVVDGFAQEETSQTGLVDVVLQCSLHQVPLILGVSEHPLANEVKEVVFDEPLCSPICDLILPQNTIKHPLVLPP